MLSIRRFTDLYKRLLPPYIPDVHGALNPNTSSVKLPDDILRLIVQIYLESVLSKAKTIRDLRKGRKEYWAAVAPLARSSMRLWEMVIDILRMIWATCCSSQCLSHSQCHSGHLPTAIRVLILGDDWDPTKLNLAPQKKLQYLSIGYHKLLHYDGPSQQLRIRPGIKAFPHSLRRLEIRHFHGLVEDLLLLVKSSCPKLVELRLYQCSMFAQPECMWWHVHTDHNDYLVGHRQGSLVGYAEKLANYTRGLPHLERFHINHYLIDMGHVFRHRFDHKQCHPRGHRDRTSPIDGVMFHSALHFAAQTPSDAPPINLNVPRLADTILWKVPCPRCSQELEESVEAAERQVASLLSANHNSLKTISFASYFSEGRTGPSEWMVEREYKNDRLLVYTRCSTLGRSRKRYRYEFERQGARWTLSG